MQVITATEAPVFDIPGVRFTAYAAPSRGSADVCAWRIRVAGELRSPQAHSLDADEVFLVLSGTLRITPEGPVLSAGDCAIVPAGTPIQLVNPSAEEATAHVVVRAGFRASMADGTSVGTSPWAQ